ncbi:Zinc finger A20 and AN1 domain-containing stress-associated protein 2 [Capsicum baccatum]|uniref:Zinc finger A20 and AN1 domain-containing stress-associated protein 2 n=1 Tax=Capsicum baccatum TaxID=33114 RepID=A0A2G2V970_CAPBA|nr:Zinc finger A20 and AN1 domain-containing stress-associated protein 2 [Capsicum baccatum]
MCGVGTYFEEPLDDDVPTDDDRQMPDSDVEENSDYDDTNDDSDEGGIEYASIALTCSKEKLYVWKRDNVKMLGPSNSNLELRHWGIYIILLKQSSPKPKLIRCKPAFMQIRMKMSKEMESSKETGFRAPEDPVLCINDCDFFNSAAMMNMCSKCQKNMVLLKNEHTKLAATSSKNVVRRSSSSDESELALAGAAVASADLASQISQVKSKEGLKKCTNGVQLQMW